MKKPKKGRPKGRPTLIHAPDCLDTTNTIHVNGVIKCLSCGAEVLL